MIWIFLADGFEETEALTTADILMRAEQEVLLIHAGNGRIATGSHGIRVICDCQADELDGSEFPQCVVLPGGMPGTLNLEKNPFVQQAIDHALANDILLGAICAAPSILGHKGVLHGKKATCFPGFEQELTGAVITGNLVEEDGQIITAKGMGATVLFGLALAERLVGKPEANKIRRSLQMEGETK